MHPQQFVRHLIAQGRSDAIASLVREYSDRLYSKATPEHRDAYAFANAFLIGVLSQLRELRPGDSIEDHKLLSVWMDLGAFGVDREDIFTFLEKEQA